MEDVVDDPTSTPADDICDDNKEEYLLMLHQSY